MRPFFLFTELLYYLPFSNIKFYRSKEIDQYMNIVHADIAHYRLKNKIPMMKNVKIDKDN